MKNRRMIKVSRIEFHQISRKDYVEVINLTL